MDTKKQIIENYCPELAHIFGLDILVRKFMYDVI